jgi:hypothetical protein
MTERPTRRPFTIMGSVPREPPLTGGFFHACGPMAQPQGRTAALSTDVLHRPVRVLPRRGELQLLLFRRSCAAARRPDQFPRPPRQGNAGSPHCPARGGLGILVQWTVSQK